MIGLDTNILIRYIVQDDAAQASAATRLIENRCTQQTTGFVSIVVLVGAGVGPCRSVRARKERDRVGDRPNPENDRVHGGRRRVGLACFAGVRVWQRGFRGLPDRLPQSLARMRDDLYIRPKGSKGASLRARSLTARCRHAPSLVVSGEETMTIELSQPLRRRGRSAGIAAPLSGANSLVGGSRGFSDGSSTVRCPCFRVSRRRVPEPAGTPRGH